MPLVPFLRAGGIRTFAEPCAGNGDLVRHLESFGLRCVYQGDIRTGQDALMTRPLRRGRCAHRQPIRRCHTRAANVRIGANPEWLRSAIFSEGEEDDE